MADIDLRVPVFDFDTGEFVIGLDGTVKTVTGSEAVGMIAVKAEETERGVFPVYGDFENEEENHVYGSDVKAYGICGDYPKDVRLSEVKRAAEEAIAYSIIASSLKLPYFFSIEAAYVLICVSIKASWHLIPPAEVMIVIIHLPFAEDSLLRTVLQLP